MSETTTNTAKKTATTDQIATAKKIVDKANGQKSEPIRQLAAMGWSQGDIARSLTAVFYPEGNGMVRPQHVSNVLRQAAAKK
jgi:methionine salvage enolase-phosphatase E1